MDLTYETVNKEQGALEEYRRGAWDYQHAATGIAVKGKKIQSRIERVYDPTAMHAFGIWSSGIIGHYMPKNINWFAEELGDRRFKDSKSVIRWLQETDEHLRYVLRASGGGSAGTNYYT
ncbi:MAG: portal protein, partial [Planctomycetota bacterium]